jgi:16S rRNA G966 N2-methylase RsmD
VRPLKIVLLCPAGFEAVVADAASQELPKFVEGRRSGGFIRGRTVAPVSQLRSFSCATNVFSVLDEVQRSTVDRELRALHRRLPELERPAGLPKRGTLRLRVHDDGRFTKTDSKPAIELERSIASWSGLSVSRRGGALEVWLLRRREEPTTILATKLSEGVRRTDRGVLRPEICAALARVEPLKSARLVLDPFAGSGVLGEACLAAGAKSVWMNDQKGDQRSKDRMRWTHEDVADLDVPPGSVDAIVTDPPWGHFSSVAGGLVELYSRIGAVAAEWLRPGGALVVLTAAPDDAVRALVGNSALEVERDHPVLINGRKARIIRARRA